jgi:DNA-binding NarL/FixJ family response regulator
LETYLKDDEKQKGKKLLQKFNEVVYGERTLDWDLLYKKMNTINNNSFDYIRNALPQLDELEFRICCLIYSDFKNTEIALALNYGVNTVQVKKSAIRKKLRITSYGNIRDYLSNLIDCR